MNPPSTSSTAQSAAPIDFAERSDGPHSLDRAALVAILGRRAKLQVTGTRDARVAAVAGLQRGRVARRQLLQAGLSGDQIAWRRRNERLFVIHSGVYAVGHRGAVALGDETAALLAAPLGALLSSRFAGALWGFLAPIDPGTEIDILVPPSASLRRAGIRAHRSSFHAIAEARVRHGLPVTSPAHTMLDLATDLGVDAVTAALHEAVVKRLLTPRDCARVLAAIPTHPGAPLLRALLADAADGATESAAEQLLGTLLGQTDLPKPRRQFWVGSYRLDYYWPQAKFGAETDGFRFHSTRRRFESDRLRDARLAALGIEIMRVTWRQMEREPLAVIARIAAALTRRTLAAH